MIVRLLLGDQLNLQHSWYEKIDPNVCYVMFEMRQETDYVRHHIQKVIAFFAAMRHFAKSLSNQGHQIIYLTLDAPENTHSLTDNLRWVFEQKKATEFHYQQPDEYRLDHRGPPRPCASGEALLPPHPSWEIGPDRGRHHL